MQGCGSLTISVFQRNAFAFEESETVSLVSLGRHMEHIYALLVLCEDISASSHQEFDQFYIPMERGKMQGTETFISPAWSIHPILQYCFNALYYILGLLVSEVARCIQLEFLHMSLLQITG